MLVQDDISQKQVINGEFSPAEARDIVNNIIDGHMNFNRQQYITRWEANHNLTQDDLQQQLNALRELKNELKAAIAQAREEGCRIHLEGSLELRLVR